MSYKNFDDTTALIAIYNTQDRTVHNGTVIFNVDTSLHAGSLNVSNEFTFTQNACLVGDFYGYSNTTGSLAISAYFVVNSSAQNMSQDRNYGGGTNSARGPEPFHANISKGLTTYGQYKRHVDSDLNVTTLAGYPRFTGVLTE